LNEQILSKGTTPLAVMYRQLAKESLRKKGKGMTEVEDDGRLSNSGGQ
jgi:hypothetical protein